METRLSPDTSIISFKFNYAWIKEEEECFVMEGFSFKY
jgi:hypothetical protein